MRLIGPKSAASLAEGTLVVINRDRQMEEYRAVLEAAGKGRNHVRFFIAGLDYPRSLKCRRFPAVAVDARARRDLDPVTWAEVRKRVFRAA